MDKHDPVKWKKGHNLAELSLAITLNYEIRLIQCNIKVEFSFPCFVVVEFLYNYGSSRLLPKWEFNYVSTNNYCPEL